MEQSRNLVSSFTWRIALTRLEMRIVPLCRTPRNLLENTMRADTQFIPGRKLHTGKMQNDAAPLLLFILLYFHSLVRSFRYRK